MPETILREQTHTYPILKSGFSIDVDGNTYLEILYQKSDGSIGHADVDLTDDIGLLKAGERDEVTVKEQCIEKTSLFRKETDTDIEVVGVVLRRV